MRRSLRPWSPCALYSSHIGPTSMVSLSGTRVTPLIGGPQVVSGDGSVNLGGGQINVTQQLLDGPQVCTALEEMGGERMSQGVGEAGHAVTEHAPHPPGVERAAPDAHEETPPGGLTGECRPTSREPPFDCSTR